MPDGEVNTYPDNQAAIDPHGGWVVARSRPQGERWAVANLHIRGHVFFRPTYIARQRDSAHRVHFVERSLFANYIFVWHDRRVAWRSIRETPGISSLLKNGHQLQYARPGAVETLQQTESARRARAVSDIVWLPGMPCILASGPFRNQPAVVMAIDRDTATVGLMLFGELREINVAVADLVPQPD